MGAASVVKHHNWICFAAIRCVVGKVANAIGVLLKIGVEERTAAFTIANWVVQPSLETSTVVDVSHVTKMTLDFSVVAHGFT